MIELIIEDLQFVSSNVHLRFLKKKFSLWFVKFFFATYSIFVFSCWLKRDEHEGNVSPDEIVVEDNFVADRHSTDIDHEFVQSIEKVHWGTNLVNRFQLKTFVKRFHFHLNETFRTNRRRIKIRVDKVN